MVSEAKHQSPSRAITDRSSIENQRPEHLQLRGIKKLSRKKRQSTLSPGQRCLSWEAKGRAPYHEYVHRLVEAGWDNLKDLDEYMSRDYEDKNLVVSVVDFTDTLEKKRREDIHDVGSLHKFLAEDGREGVRVRLYLAEQRGSPSSAVMEAFGSHLRLDPRFFQWNIGGSKNLLSPADRHRAPFTSIGFTVLNRKTDEMTDTTFFRITIYVQSDLDGNGWTGSFHPFPSRWPTY